MEIVNVESLSSSFIKWVRSDRSIIRGLLRVTMIWRMIILTVLLTLYRLGSSLAYPNAQSNAGTVNDGDEGGDSSSGDADGELIDEAILNINGKLITIPVFRGWKIYPMNPPASITDALVVKAPLGFGCFFWYAERDFTPLLLSNSRTLSPMPRYLSQTFYSPQTYTTYDQAILAAYPEIRFPDAEFLTCFTLPDAGSDAFGDTVGLWFEVAGEDPLDGALPTRTSSRIYLLPMEELYSGEAHGPARGFLLNGNRVERVAVVHSPGPDTWCRIFFRVEGQNAYLDFSAGVPLSGPFEETRTVECFKNGPPPVSGGVVSS